VASVAGVIAGCPICGAPGLARSVATARLQVSRCPVCGHRVAVHQAPPQTTAIDYHEQYDQGAFLASLAATRQRQAAVIIELIRRRLSDADRLLDFGAGRGWFLEACRGAGFQSLAGVDTSELAVSSLRDRQFAAQMLSPSTDYSDPLRRLPFRPRIVTMLDVIEHFPSDGLGAALDSILRGLQPELELLVIKVPDAGGLLYGGAQLLARIGLTGPIEQLYQVGTDPPHFHYFTHRSMRRLLESHELTIVATQGDRDFEPDSFGQRARPLAGMPAVARVAGSAAARLADLTGWYDAAIYLAAPR
jgi:Methyltransferase domain